MLSPIVDRVLLLNKGGGISVAGVTGGVGNGVPPEKDRVGVGAGNWNNNCMT